MSDADFFKREGISLVSLTTGVNGGKKVAKQIVVQNNKEIM